MFDIRWIRDNPEAFDAGLRKRGIEPGGEVKFSGELIVLDEARRKVVTRLQEAQARRNAASKEIGKAKGAKDEAKAAALMAEVAALKDELAAGEKAQAEADKALHEALSVIPNLPREEVPVGKDEKDNKEVRRVGEPPKLGVDQQAQAALRDRRGAGPDGLRDGGEAVRLPLRGAEGRSSRGSSARWRRSCSICTRRRGNGIGGYTEIMPPYLVRDEVMYGTAQLPKFRGRSVSALVAEQLPNRSCRRVVDCAKQAGTISLMQTLQR